MFTSNVLNNKRFRQMKRARLWKNVILWAISRREILPLVVIFRKKLINLHGGLLHVTTNIYLKSCAYHPDAECCTFFHGIWANQNPLKRHCYTCMSFETCWSRLIYIKLSSHRSFVINMYCVAMAWRCISPWGSIGRPKEDGKWTVFDISADFRAF